MEASFGAGAVLCTVAVACIKKVHTANQVAFACIPLLFATQQFSEGFLWLSLSNPEYSSWKQPMTVFFLVTAHIIWPLFIPVSVFLLEKDPKRKKVLLFLSLIGMALAAYFGWWLLYHHAEANADGHHIFYDRNFPLQLRMFINAGYAITAVLPLFVSGIKRMWTLGLMFFVSFIMAKIFYTTYVISVWCFFAAILSIIVFLILQTGAISVKNKHLIRQ